MSRPKSVSPRAARVEQRLLQHFGLEQVVAHRGVGARRVAGHRAAALRGFSRNSLTRPSAAVVMMPKLDACAIGTATAETVTSARALAVEGDHLAHVHAVDVVGGEHRHHVGRMRLQQVEVLVDRVGGALELAAQGIGARQQRP